MARRVHACSGLRCGLVAAWVLLMAKQRYWFITYVMYLADKGSAIPVSKLIDKHPVAWVVSMNKTEPCIYVLLFYTETSEGTYAAYKDRLG